MKTLDSQCDYNSEKTPTIASCKTNGAWTNNKFLLGSKSPIGLIVSLARVEGRGGLKAEPLIKSFLLLFVCWKKNILKMKCESGEFVFW
jgi:hypothetical protein